MLQTLEPSRNELSGSIPAGVGNLTELAFFSVSNNQFSGAIPPRMGNLTKLTHLHLEKNQFSGTLPAELKSLTALQSFFIANNQFEGNIPVVYRNLINLTTLDLANNPSLTGTLPSEMTTMPLNFFSFGNTGLCTNMAPSFQSWLPTISNLTISACTNVSLENDGRVPEAFALHQNYPNSFNPTTQISIDLPESARMKVFINNVYGQEVGVIVDGVQSAGTHHYPQARTCL